MSYSMVVLPSKNAPLSMTDVVVQFLLRVSEEIVSRNLRLLRCRLLGFFQCEVVAFGCKNVTTSFHNLISGKRFVKSRKHKSSKEVFWHCGKQCFSCCWSYFSSGLWQGGKLTVAFTLIITGKSNWNLNIWFVFTRKMWVFGVLFVYFFGSCLVGWFFPNNSLVIFLSDGCTCQQKLFL